MLTRRTLLKTTAAAAAARALALPAYAQSIPIRIGYVSARNRGRCPRFRRSMPR